MSERGESYARYGTRCGRVFFFFDEWERLSILGVSIMVSK